MVTAVLEINQINAWPKFCFFHACASLVRVRDTKPAQASKKQKKNKALDAQNLHTHQKKQSLSIYSGLGVYRLQNVVVFCFFWCLRRFFEDHALFFFVFFDACACLEKVRVTKPAQASKKTKNQTTRCTKPAQASKNKKNKVWASTQGWGSVDCEIVFVFGFFWCLCRFCEDHVLVFVGFFMPVHVLSKSAEIKK